MTARRRARDLGAGLLSTTFGIGVFLAMLGLSAHVLLNLWSQSVVEDVATTAAARVATSGVVDDHLAAVQADAIERARSELGDSAAAVDLQFEPDPTGRTIRLRVRSSTIDLLPALGRVDLDVGELDRVIVRRRELTGAGR